MLACVVPKQVPQAPMPIPPTTTIEAHIYVDGPGVNPTKAASVCHHSNLIEEVAGDITPTHIEAKETEYAAEITAVWAYWGVAGQHGLDQWDDPKTYAMLWEVSTNTTVEFKVKPTWVRTMTFAGCSDYDRIAFENAAVPITISGQMYDVQRPVPELLTTYGLLK